MIILDKKISDWNNIDFQEGAVLLVNKPLNWTSFDVVNKLRYLLKKGLKLKKFKVGHAGTLDPLATGLLIICVGKSTKDIDQFMGLHKRYSGEMCLGATTPSFDLETEIDQTYPIHHIDTLLLDSTTAKLSGTIDQYPPMFSAIKVDGVPLYKSARKGESVEIKSRAVSITNFKTSLKESEESNVKRVVFDVTCSKGTYIRSLAYDFGVICQSGAHLTSLRRESIGVYENETYNALYEAVNAFEMDEICDLIQSHFNLVVN